MSLNGTGLKIEHLLSRKIFCLWLACAVLISVGSLMPLNHVPSVPTLITDKLQHVIAYSLLGILSLFCSKSVLYKTSFFTLSFLFGVAIEILQPYSGRYFEVNDILANGTGLLVSFPIFWVIQMRIQRTAAGEKNTL